MNVLTNLIELIILQIFMYQIIAFHALNLHNLYVNLYLNKAENSIAMSGLTCGKN